MIETGDWVATRLNGEVDYSVITKPPLMVWLVALCFKTLGISAVSLRLVSIVAAWVTVLVLMLWAARVLSPLAGITAGVVLATSFGFMFVHSGRTGNTDALFALLTLLTAVLLHASSTRPRARLALGVVLAAMFLLRGPGMLMPLLIVVVFELWHRPAAPRGRTWLAACVLFAIPVGAWAFARWRADGWSFLAQVWTIDLVTRTVTTFEGHAGTPLYYVDILQRYHFDWLLAGVAAVVLFAPSRSELREWLSVRSDADPSKVVIMAWAGVTFLIPTLMKTKLSWYLNPFYPVFALLVGAVLQRALLRTGTAPRSRTAALLAVVMIALGSAEGRMIYQAYRRDATYFVQGLLERERAVLAGQRIFRFDWNAAERFVATRMIGSRVERVSSPERFIEVAAEGDFLVAEPGLTDGRLEKIREMAGAALYRRTAQATRWIGPVAASGRPLPNDRHSDPAPQHGRAHSSNLEPPNGLAVARPCARSAFSTDVRHLGTRHPPSTLARVIAAGRQRGTTPRAASDAMERFLPAEKEVRPPCVGIQRHCSSSPPRHSVSCSSPGFSTARPPRSR
jgi:hypothetical protein